jgi:exodeoxyribonuclease V
MKTKLSPDQQVAFDTFIEAFNEKFSKNNRFTNEASLFCLSGFAGTGKTHLIGEIVKWVSKNRKKDFPIGLCAPTNKAVNVLSEKIEQVIGNTGNTFYGTIQSFLKMKYIRQEDGKEFFEYDKNEKKENIPFSQFKICFIDEASMISREMLEAIDLFINPKSMVIFIGDPAQLPPINEKISRSFLLEDLSGKKSFAKLSKIIRQGEHSTIIPLSKELRKTIFSSKPSRFNISSHKELFENSHDIKFCDKSLILNHAFIESSTDEDRILCFTNREVDYYNNLFHNKFFPESNSKFCVGERVIINSPHIIGLTIDEKLYNLEKYKSSDKEIYDVTEDMLTNNEECLILDISKSNSYIPFSSFKDLFQIGLDQFDSRIITINNVELERDVILKDNPVVSVATTDDTILLDQLIKLSFDNWRYYKNLAHKINTKIEKNNLLSKSYLCSKIGWGLKDFFCDIKHSYAMTIHKSQGSTFKKVFIDLNDVSTIKDPVLFNQCLYVAITRPSDELTFVIGSNDIIIKQFIHDKMT